MPDYEIRQEGMVQAAVSGPNPQARAEAEHYFAQYSQDATEEFPVELVEVTVVKTTAGV